MPFVIDPNLANDYRKVLGIPDAPNMIEPNLAIQPVVVLNQGLPSPKSNQVQRTFTFRRTGTGAATFQIATPTNNKRILLQGITIMNNLAATSLTILFDASTGSSPSIASGSGYYDEAGVFDFYGCGAAISCRDKFFPMPLVVKQGLRIEINAYAGSDVYGVVYFLEESI
jgi:hypothetical protein